MGEGFVLVTTDPAVLLCPIEGKEVQSGLEDEPPVGESGEITFPQEVAGVRRLDGRSVDFALIFFL